MKPKVLDGLVLVYGLLLIVLGLIGYFRAGSVMSLAGVVAGALVLGFLAITAKKRQIGRIGVAVVTLLLLFQFGRTALGLGKTAPGYQAYIISIASLIVFVALGLGHMAAMKERRLE